MAMLALGGTLLSTFIALKWAPAWIAAGLFSITTIGLLALALRPAIEIYDAFLAVGDTQIPWTEIRRIDQTGWNAPLAVYLTLADESRMLILHTGDIDSSTALLRHLRKYSREALLDGIPYKQFWGESVPAQLPAAKVEPPKQLPPARFHVLRPEDEDEVERMFQQLKAVGRIGEQRSSDEN
jgi:hypothetical protein